MVSSLAALETTIVMEVLVSISTVVFRIRLTRMAPQPIVKMLVNHLWAPSKTTMVCPRVRATQPCTTQTQSSAINQSTTRVIMGRSHRRICAEL